MKKILVIALLIAFSVNAAAQEASVEKSVFSIQTGIIGVWANHELGLSRQFALRTEVGLEMGIIVQGSSEEVEGDYVGIASISAEPKWYYNLDKRVRKGYGIAKNSGNSFSLRAMYNPNWFVLSSYDNLNVVSQLAVIPKWGIRRVYGKHFNFETGFGIGPVFYFPEKNVHVERNVGVYPDVHLRVGYAF